MAIFKARQDYQCAHCAETIHAGEMSQWPTRGNLTGLRWHPHCYDLDERTRKQSTPSTPKPATNGHESPANDAVWQMFAGALEPYLTIQREEITEQLESKIHDIVSAAIENLTTKTVYIQSGRTIGEVTGVKHEHFDTVYDLVSSGTDVYLYGEAGSGKTSAAKQIADTLQRPFKYLAIHFQMNESRLLGYMFGEKYIETDFFQAYTQGGIFLLDEMDMGNSNLLGVLNGALANGYCAFPCGRYDRHPDFVCIGAGNTCMLGATTAFESRKSQDGAVRDRFIFVQWDTDKTLERQLSAQHFEHSDQWVKWVQSVREYVKKPHPKLMVTQRASITGSKLLARGYSASQVAQMVVFKGYDAVAVNGILSAYPLPTF